MSRSKKTWNHLVDYYGNYGIDIKNGIYPGSGPARKGDKGNEGPAGQKGDRGFQGAPGRQGKKGDVGPEGAKGLKGDSAYEIAVDNGFQGTEIEYLASLKGDKGLKGEKGDRGEEGLDAYQTAVKGGFSGTQSQWEDSLIGEKGNKGDQGGLFTYKGREDTLQDIEALPGPHEPGDVYQDDSTDDLYVWDGSQFVLLSQQLDVIKGQKGDKGEEGEIGDSAYELAVKNGFIGTEQEWVESLKGQQGAKGETGDSAYESAVKDGFPGDETAWLESLKGDQGDEGLEGADGDKGDQGDQGDSAYDTYVKGTTDSPPLTEGAWLDSLKGDKGDDADPRELEDYYDKNQINELFETYSDPKDAYSINYMGEEAAIDTGVIDFEDSNQNAAHYERGMVEVGVNVVANNCPLTPPFLITNFVLVDELVPRGADYTILQQITSVDALGGERYTRTARPGTDEFGEWFQNSFDISNYYDKETLDEKFGEIVYALDHNLNNLTLTDKDGYVQSVPLIGQNGIQIYSTVAGIHFDTSALSGAQFLGVLNDGQDPDVVHAALNYGDKQQGQFFIYAYDGTTVNTNPDAADCTVGDWCIYSTVDSEWKYLDVSTDPGVVSVQTSGGLLTVDATDPANPVVGLDPDKVVQPDALDAYLKKDTAAAAFAAQNLEDLSDVGIEFSRINPGGVTSPYISHKTYVDGTPADNGEYSVDIAANEIHFYYKGSSGSAMDSAVFDWIDIDDDSTLVRITEENYGQSVVAHPIEKRKDGVVRVIKFDEPNPALFALAAEGAFVFDIVSNSVGNGDVLAWNESTGQWENKPFQSDLYVERTGDTMSGKLDINVGLAQVGLKVLGGLRIKRENDLNGKNCLSVSHDKFICETTTTFKRGESSSNVVDFSIEGRLPNSTTNTNQLFTVYRVADNTGDAMNYYGRIENENNIINKGHLDETINFQQYPELT